MTSATKTEPQPNVSVTGIEVLRPGTFTDMSGQVVTVTLADMVEMVETYDPASFASPLVKGHPKHDDPAYGLICNPRVIGDRLVIDAEEVEPQFAAEVNAKRYNGGSLSFWRPNDRGNPVPGKHRMKHWGALGAIRAAVSGLKPLPAFADDDASVCIIIPSNIPNPKQPNPKQEVNLSQEAKDEAVALAAQRTDLEKREAAVKADREAMAKERADAVKADAVAFAAEQVAAFKLHPSRKDEVVHLMVDLGRPEAVAFAADGKTKSSLQILKDVISSAKPAVQKGEFAKAEGGGAGGEAVNFAAPSGYEVDPDRLQLHGRALAIQSQNPALDYAAAVQLASNGGI